ncbi:PRD domain-containing protein, partial [Staphylococcus haemolyticus]
EYIYAQDVFIDMVKNHYPNAYNTAFKISKMIQKHLNIPIDDSEIVYLALHIYHFENQINSSHN